MALAAGTSLGVYQVAAPLGAGGMGEVYRARDPRLDRDVALKVLRQDVAVDADRQARFLHEAKAVSALNHPNIVTVHDVGTASGIAYMVMELVDGRPLDQVIPRHGMPAGEVLRIGVQIADAFAAAHAAGIIHRDLKPANVIVQPNGRVKVLDFGLAKLVRQENGWGSGLTVTGTADGMIVGTAAYMSPEQAEGRPLDARSDIFSFGALLYELCSGTRAFAGDSHASVLANVLRQDPRPLHDVRPDLPTELTRLVMRCLRKDPDRRVQSMADLKVAFDELREDLDSGRLPSAAMPPVSRTRSIRLPIAVGVVGLAIIGAAGYLWSTRPAADPVAEAAPTPKPLTTYAGREADPSFSPDANQIAFTWNGESGGYSDIYVQLIGAGTPVRITTDPLPDFGAEWSPDGRFLAFIRRLGRTTVNVLVVPALGGSERRLAQLQTRLSFDAPLVKLSWTRDAKFLFVSGNSGEGPNHIYRIDVQSAALTQVATHDGPGEGYGWVTVSPDGKTLAAIQLSPDPRQVRLFDVTSTADLGPARTLETVAANISAVAWTADARELILRRAANLPLPLERVRVDGSSPPVDMPWTGADALTPAIGANGRLAFARIYRDTNIWRIDLTEADAARSLRQLASSSFREVHPDYSPDGKRLVFHSNRGGSVQVWTADADGSRAAQLTTMEPFATTGSPRWSPDGQRVIFDSNATGVYQLYEISAEGGAARPLTSGRANSFGASYSPDGGWVYFTSDRSGRQEVWRMAASGGDPEQVTRSGGTNPLLSADGAWIYFIKDGGTGGLWRLPVAGGSEARLIDLLYRWNFALTADGIYYATRPLAGPPSSGPASNSTIRFRDWRTGAERDILAIDKPVDLGFAISPDGRYLLFTKLDYAGTDLMLVENFR